MVYFSTVCGTARGRTGRGHARYEVGDGVRASVSAPYQAAEPREDLRRALVAACRAARSRSIDMWSGATAARRSRAAECSGCRVCSVAAPSAGGRVPEGCPRIAPALLRIARR